MHESHARERLPPAARRGQRPDRRAHDGAALHLPLQRQLDDEPDPRRLPRARLLLQPLPRQAARARGRRRHHVAPDAVGVQPGAPPELHRLLRAGAGRDDRPVRDRVEVRGGLRHRPVVRAPLPHELRLPRRPPASTCGTGARTPSSTSAASSSSAATGQRSAGWASPRRRPSPTPSRSPRTSSAGTRRSPTSTRLPSLAEVT